MLYLTSYYHAFKPINIQYSTIFESKKIISNLYTPVTTKRKLVSKLSAFQTEELFINTF